MAEARTNAITDAFEDLAQWCQVLALIGIEEQNMESAVAYEALVFMARIHRKLSTYEIL